MGAGVKWVRGLAIFLAVRIPRPYCGAEMEDTGIYCSRRRHRGMHRCRTAWNDPPAPPPFDAEANPGYARFLASKYGPRDRSAS